jgi:hypothetical protein
MEHGGLYATQDYHISIILVTGMWVIQELYAVSLDTKNWVSINDSAVKGPGILILLWPGYYYFDIEMGLFSSEIEPQ